VPASKRQAAVVSHTLRLSSDSNDQTKQALQSNSSGGSGASGDSRQPSAAAAARHVTLQPHTLRKPSVQSVEGRTTEAAVQSSRQALPRLPDAAAPQLRPIRTAPPTQLPPTGTSATAERPRRIVARHAAASGGTAVGHKPSYRSRGPRSVGSEGSRGRRVSVLLPKPSFVGLVT
jgi:hypothetical protein